MSYGLLNDNVIYNSKQCNVVEQGFIYEKAYPSEHLKPIVFHAVDDIANVEDHVKSIIHDYGTQDIPDDQLFTINLEGLTIGNYFFGGLIYDSMTNTDEFVKDMKAGRIQLALINLIKASSDGCFGILLLDLLDIYKEVMTPIVHIFIPAVTAKDILNHINDQLGDKYFIKYGNDVFND